MYKTDGKKVAVKPATVPQTNKLDEKFRKLEEKINVLQQELSKTQRNSRRQAGDLSNIISSIRSRK